MPWITSASERASVLENSPESWREPEANAALSSRAVQEFLRSRLANFKVPKDIQFLDALPREASGKIFKRKLRDLHAEGGLRAAR